MGFILDWTRLFIILIPQSITILSFSFIAYKILSRRRDRDSILLSSFYITLSIAFIMNLIVILLIALDLQLEKLIIFLYYFLTYLILLSIIFLVLFITNIHFISPLLGQRITMTILIIYSVLSLVILCQPDGISFLGDDYIIQYSVNILISAYIFIFISIIIPSFYFSVKNSKKMNFPSLKKKYKLFTFGFGLILLDIYGAILYNTWHYPPFRAIWSGITSFLLITSAFLIYYGVGKDLKSVKSK